MIKYFVNFAYYILVWTFGVAPAVARW